LLAYLIPEFSDISVNPSFDKSELCDFISYFSNDNKTFSLDSVKYNVALHLTDSKDGSESNSLARVQYFFTVRDDASEPAQIVWVNTTTCKNLFN